MKKFTRGIPALLLLSGTLLLWPQAAKPADSKSAPAETVRTGMVVSTQWLADHLADPHLVLVHVGGSPADYHAAHIPGARHLPGDKLVDPRPPGTELLPAEQIKKNFEELGISDESRVVFYSADWDPIATRFFFTLDYIGHADRASLLDGGMDQWMLEKRPTSSDDPKFTPGSLTINLHPEVLARMDWVAKVVSDPAAGSSVAVIDSRPIKRYRFGHLPGAAPLFWEKALVSAESPMLKPPQELRSMLLASGAAPGKKIVSYCEVGWQASYTYFIAKYLGYDAAMYDGSYVEWNGARQPVVRGDARR